MGIAMQYLTQYHVLVSKVIGILLCLIIGWVFAKVMNKLGPKLIKKAAKQDGARQHAAGVRALIRLAKIGVWIILSLVILGLLDVPLSGLLTFGGVGGIAIALSAKDLLANFAGGMMIYMNRHFSVGDWIYSPDRDLQGTVEDIGWRLTRIRSFGKRPIYVPNAIFNNVIIVNASKMTNRRIKQTMGLRYDDADKIELILADIRKMLGKHKDIDQKTTTLVNLIDQGAFGPSEISFMIYTFANTIDWAEFQKIQDNVMLKVYAIITKHGAQIAFPTRTVQLEK